MVSGPRNQPLAKSPVISMHYGDIPFGVESRSNEISYLSGRFKSPRNQRDCQPVSAKSLEADLARGKRYSRVSPITDIRPGGPDNKTDSSGWHQSKTGRRLRGCSQLNRANKRLHQCHAPFPEYRQGTTVHQTDDQARQGSRTA